ncbi:MAG: hypothetical protein ABJB22_06815, partial [Verrucomicrobiota bacterium]
MSDRLFFAAVVTQLFFALMIRGELRAAPADEEFSQATRLAAAGAFEDSVAHWKKAETLFEQAKNFAGQVETEIHLAAAYHALGQTRLATETFVRAQDLASLKDPKHLAQIKAGLGAIYILSSPPLKDHSLHGHMPEHEEMAESLLKESIKLSRAAKDRHTEAVARNNLGNFYSYRNRGDDAAKEYKAANELATTSSDPALASQACANLARTYVDSGEYDNAKTWAGRVVEKASRLPDSHDKAYQLIGASRTFNAIFLAAPDHDNALRLRAFEALQ